MTRALTNIANAAFLGDSQVATAAEARRIYSPQNSQPQTVRLVNASTGASVPSPPSASRRPREAKLPSSEEISEKATRDEWMCFSPSLKDQRKMTHVFYKAHSATRNTLPSLRRTCSRLIIGVVLLSSGVTQAHSPTLPKHGTLRFKLERAGLVPASVAIQPGTFCLQVVNPLVRADLTVGVNDPNGQMLSQKVMSSKFTATQLCVTLPQGQSTLYIAENPNWKATINAEAQ